VPGLPPTLSSLPPSSIPPSHLSYTTTSIKSAGNSSRASSKTTTAKSKASVNDTKPWWYTGSLFGNATSQQQQQQQQQQQKPSGDDTVLSADLTSTIEETGSAFSDSIMDNNNNVESKIAPSTIGSSSISQRGGSVSRGETMNNRRRRSSLNSGTSTESESFVFGTNAYESKPAVGSSKKNEGEDLQQSISSSIQEDNNNHSLMLSYNPIESSSYNNLSSSQNQSMTSSNNQLSISHNTSIQSSSFQQHNQLVPTDANTFIPQKFNEMRTLLSAITPLQLEALMYEIFNIPTTTNNTILNTLPTHFPKGWSSTIQKSKSRKFRKDAYLSEMSFNEIKRYCIDKNIVGMEETSSLDEALDLISVEFERLVFVYQNGITPNEDDNHDASQSGTSMNKDREETTAIQPYNTGGQDEINMDESLQTSIMSNSQTSLADESANLRQSLRVCSLAELRLIADRLQLDYSTVGNDKVALISMIENSMPEVMSLDDGWCSFSQQQQQQQQQQDGRHYDNPNEEGEDNDHDESQQNRRRRSVQFSNDCKQDTSHLIPKRDKGGSWQSFVVGSDGARRHTNTDDDNVQYADEEGIGYNVDEESEDVSSLSTLFRSYRKRGSSRLGSRRGRSSQRMIRIYDPLLQSMPNMPWKGNERKCLGFIIVLIIVISVSVSLTKDDSTSDESNWIMPEGFNFDVGDSNDEVPLVSIQPSMFPSKVKEDGIEGYPSHNTGGGSSSSSSSSTSESSWSWFETSSSSVLGDKEDDEQEEFEGAVFIALPTLRPTSDGSLEELPSLMPSLDIPEQDTSSSPTLASVDTGSISSNSPTLGSITSTPMRTNSPTAQSNEATETSPEPTNPEYELLGPYDETNMQMVLYGISELGRMGQTQFNMLTAAYVEQFFNREGQQGEDAIQNIVFDVVSQVEFDSQETLRQATGSSRATSTRHNNLRRVLQNDDGIIVTFTMTISYRTFSPSIKSDTVSQQPFYDEDIRHEYVDFLEANGAFMHMGYISQVSSIFFPGDDIPNPPRDIVSTSRPSYYQITMRPTKYPITPAPFSPAPSMRKETGQPSPSPTKRITAEPTPSPTTLKPTQLPSKKPVTPMPTGPKPETYYPTPSALMIPFPTYKPTSA